LENNWQIILQIPETADTIIEVPLSTSSLESKLKTDSNEGGWIHLSGKGRLRETGSASAALPAISRSTFPRKHQPKDLSHTPAQHLTHQDLVL
jgi:hypothetical protein